VPDATFIPAKDSSDKGYDRFTVALTTPAPSLTSLGSRRGLLIDRSNGDTAQPMAPTTHATSTRRLVVLLAVLWAAAALLVWPAHAQTQSHLDSAHFRVFFDGDPTPARRVLEVSEELYASIARSYPLEVSEPIRTWLVASTEEAEALMDAPIRDWARGYAFPLERRIVIVNPTGVGRMEELDRITRHEVAHICLGVLIGDHVTDIPLWFHEGFAMYVSEPWTMRHRWTVLGNAIFRATIPLDAMTEGFPAEQDRAQLAYAESFSAVRLLVNGYSFSQLKTLLERLRRGEEFEQAFTTTFGVTTAMYAIDWHETATDGMEWLALIGGVLALGSFFTPFLVLGYWRRRRARRARMDEWAAEEAKPDAFFR
jgi:hypothetical protein